MATVTAGRLSDRLMRTVQKASTHYPCVKRAWVDYLGEHPEPSLDRVE
jgi:hypothetical protein